MDVPREVLRMNSVFQQLFTKALCEHVWVILTHRTCQRSCHLGESTQNFRLKQKKLRFTVRKRFVEVNPRWLSNATNRMLPSVRIRMDCCVGCRGTTTKVLACFPAGSIVNRSFAELLDNLQSRFPFLSFTAHHLNGRDHKLIAKRLMTTICKNLRDVIGSRFDTNLPDPSDTTTRIITTAQSQ